MSSAPTPRDRKDFHVAILCALSLEADAMMAALDHEWTDKKFDPLSSDINSCTLGAIGEHNIVIVHLPGTRSNRAASAVSRLQISYPNIKLALVVGICGGMPNGVKDEEILLGDVVISKVLIEYDAHKTYPNGPRNDTDVFNTLSAPSEKILGLLNKLETKRHRQNLQTQTATVLGTIQKESREAQYPGPERDTLYVSSYAHKHHTSGQCPTCDEPGKLCETACHSECEVLKCEPSKLVHRQRLSDPSSTQPAIHIGKMGCASSVMKSGQHRDELARELGVIAVEMEGAGVWRHGPSLVIKGVSDYADSHKNDIWQQYAATTAAACTKAFLLEWWAPERRDEYSGPSHVHFNIPNREKAMAASRRGHIAPRTRRRASRHEGHPPGQPDSSDEPPTQPGRRSTEDDYDDDDDDDDTVRTDNAHNETSLSSKSERTWKEYLESLEFEQMDDREKIIKRSAQGTYEWLFVCPEYQQWTRERGLFVVQGNLGCGKSTLAKHVLLRERDRATQEKSGALNISFFFHGAGTVLERSLDGLFRSLIWQLIDGDEKLRKLFQQLCREVFPLRRGKEADLVWERQRLQEVFEKLLTDASIRRHVTIIIDAVNELRKKDYEELVQFLRPLNSSTQARLPKIGVFVTCQRHAAIQVEPVITVHLDKQNGRDIQNYLVEQLPLPDETQEEREELLALIKDRARGSFLFAALLIPRLQNSARDADSFAAMKEIILQCPQELTERYSRLLDGMDETRGGEISALFQWICFAARPLSVEEFRIAFLLHTGGVLSTIEEYTRNTRRDGISNGKKLRTKMTRLSQGLVDFSTADPADDGALVRFFHDVIEVFMLKEGLTMVQDKIGGAGNLVQAASAQLTDTCLRFFATKEVSDAMWNQDLETLNGYPLFTYARDHWHKHAVDAENNDVAHMVDWTLHTALSAWIHVRRHSRGIIRNRLVEGTSLIHIAARYGLVTLVRKLLSDDCGNKESGPQPAAGLRTQSSVGTPPNKLGTRSSSSIRGNKSLNTRPKTRGEGSRSDVAKPSAGSKLQKSALANSVGAGRQGKNSRPTSPSPASRGQKDSLLSTRGRRCADAVDVQDVTGTTPLMMAASEGKIAVVELLCEFGADVHSQNKMEWTPLLMASTHGRADVVKFLLDRNAEINRRTNGSGSTQGHEMMAKLPLLEYIFGYNSVTDFPPPGGYTALNAASESGHTKVIECLLERGADTHAATKDGRTPLYSASARGHLKVVECLLKHDADVHTRDQNDYTALHAASDSGHLPVVECLLEHKADIHAMTEDGQTPLYLASSSGHPKVLKYLLRHGADRDVKIAAKGGWTPLIAASTNGHLPVVECLLEREADVHAATEGGQTSLYAASRTGHLKVVQHLFEHKASVHARNRNGWTPLCVASSNGHLQVVQYLLAHGAEDDIHVTTKGGQTPLYSASVRGHHKVVEYLFEHGAEADVRTRNKGGWTPLNAASDGGHSEVAEWLLEHGASEDIELANNGGWTPLHTASRGGHLDVVRCLLEREAPPDVHFRTKTGQTPLYSASLQGHHKVVEYLFEHGAGDDIRTTNDDGWTPLCAACEGGHLEVVKTLLQKLTPADIHTPTKNGQTPLYTASKNGHQDVVEYLLEHGAVDDIDKVNEGGFTPLNVASDYGHLGVVKHLLLRAPPDNIHIQTKTGQTPLYSASVRGHHEVVEYLFEHGAEADVRTRNKGGWTPLNAASDGGHLKVVEYLFKHGAADDVTIANHYGETPLCAASDDGHVEVVKYLLLKGAHSNIDKATENGWTALYTASRFGHAEVIQVLLEAGADANIRGPFGQTPLICSAIYSPEVISKFLSWSSVQRTLTDEHGRTAADWLKLLDRDDELLESLGSNPNTPTEVSKERLRASIVKLSTVILGRRVEDSASSFNTLGHYFVALNEVEHACVAFRQKIETTAQRANVQHGVSCDSCSNYPIKGSRFVCKTCPDTDLCKACMDKYRNGEHFASCNMHEYLEVPGSDSTPLDGGTLRAWLQDNVDRYARSE